MKIKNVFVFVILLFICSPIIAKNNQELFLQAVQLQQDKKFKEALGLYEQINPKGRAVDYNMGLTYYALNNCAYALVHLQRAQRYAPSNEYAVIAQHITTIKKQLGQPAIASFWYTALARWASGISLLLFQLLFLFLWYVMWWKRNVITKSRKRTLLLIVWGIFLAVSTIGLFVKVGLQRYTGGVVIEKEVLLRVGPQKEYDSVGTLAYADQVTIIKKVDNWYLVKSGASRGWVSADSVIAIE